MREIEKTGNGANLPSLPPDFAAKLISGIAESRSTTIIAGGKPFLRLLKGGRWVYGPENIAVEEGSHWQVNILSLQHGCACWVEGELRGELMVSMVEPKPLFPPPIADKPYLEQRSCDLKCVSGEDDGTEVLYKTTSTGGMRAFDKLIVAIQNQLAVNPEFSFPVLELHQDSYDHDRYGETWIPIFDIVGWANIHGQPLQAAAAIAQKEKPWPDDQVLPTRRVAKEAPQPAQEADPGPVSTTQVRRRRPTR